MRTIIVDDEPWMLKRFAIECEGLPDVQLLGSFRNPLKALEFAGQNPVELAFLDIEMPELNGLELAHKLREINQNTIVIFVSAYDSYMTEAFRTKTADYFIMKPYNTGDIEAAVDRARLLSGRLRKAIFARTLGAFELFSGNKPVMFADSKSKELLALLIDRRGGIVSVKEAAQALWAQLPLNEGEICFYRTLKRLNDALAILHLDGIVEKVKAGAFIHTNVMDCDLYQFLDGDPRAMRQYTGEYMVGYAWAEERRVKLSQQSKLLGVFHDAQIRNALLASICTLDDSRRTICYMNDAFLALVGYTREEIEERFQNSFRAMVLREDFDHAQAAVRQLLETGKTAEVQYRIVGKDDRELWVICKSELPKHSYDGVREISSVLVDISKAKAEQHSLEKAAYHDSLTGLYNRSFAQTKIEQYLSTGFSPSGALILMDVDNFKAVNDTYGHPFADTVLMDIAAMLKRSFRGEDIVCRLGGDEMMVFLKGIYSEPVAKEKLKSASKGIQERLCAKTPRGELSCSFGAAMCPQNGRDFETLYGNADRALYKAKEKKNRAVWFSETETNPST